MAITPEQWNEIKPILEEALEIDVVERRRFLFERVPNGETRQEIASLLDFDEASRDLMGVSASEFAGEMLLDAAPSPLVGKTVGNYLIDSELGIGGMGAVYLAHRTDGKFERTVAVKMLRREYNSARLRRRFEFEKDIQAQLLHPNIAELLDAGTTDDGIPYIVMEYIDGTPIDRYCAEKELSLRDRLKLFNKACDAVSFAHHRLVVHRDLKPSNILVNNDGEPKLLDFGISKLLGAESDVDHTVTNLRVMTPQYASPEQLNGESVTTATDVYSLGVVLFKVLTGTYPYALTGKTNGDGMPEITNSAPQLPSEAVERQDLELSAQTNANASPIHSSQLKGDVDRIASKAIRVEPDRRYESVEQFSADIWRFLDGHPIIARAPTLRYRAEKFFARNKVAAIAGATVLIALLTGIGIAVSQARSARVQAQAASDAKGLAEQETAKAKAESERAEKVSRFMARIVSYANPAWYAEGSRFGGDARVLDAIEDLSDKIDQEFANEPDIAAELHHKFSEAFGMASRGQTGERLEKLSQRFTFHALRALQLRRSHYGEWHELVAKDLFYSSGAIGKDDRERAGLLALAIAMMRDTNPKNLNLPYMLEAYTAYLLLPNIPPEKRAAYRSAVIPPTDENEYQIAEKYLRESLPVFRLHYKTPNRVIYSTECKLALALVMQDKWTDFDAHYAICREGAEGSTAQSSSIKPYLGYVDKAIAEKRAVK